MRMLVLASLTTALTACATMPGRPRTSLPNECAFAVVNQTPYAMAVRMGVRRFSSVEIGALNPGELLHHKVPCSQGTVYVRGIAIPRQVGASTPNGFVQGWAFLSEGERVIIPLSWP